MRFAKNDALKSTVTLGVFLSVLFLLAVVFTGKPAASPERPVASNAPPIIRCAGETSGPLARFGDGALRIDAGAADSVRLSFAERFVELELSATRVSSNPQSPFYSDVLSGANLTTLASVQSTSGDLVLGALSTDNDFSVVTTGRLTSSESLSTTGKLSLSASDLWLSGKVYAREVALNASNILNLEKDTQVALRDGANGGKLTANARVTFNGAQITAAGATGGAVVFNSTNFLQYGSIDANGNSGIVELNFSGEFKQVEAAKITANDGAITLNGGTTATMYNSGMLNAANGSIKLFGKDLTLAAAHIDASGELGGGTVLIGGDYQGKGDAPTAAKTTINSYTEIKADANVRGNGGKVIIWSNEATRFSGKISARGGKESGDGGFVEISSKDKLGHNGSVDSGAGHGKAGTLLLDPHIVTISNLGGFFSNELIDSFPGAGNQFGSAVVVLPNGNVVVRDHLDDFVGADSGAVHLYNGQTQALISSLTGAAANDRVGNGSSVSICVLDLNGNYVVTSPNWNGNRGAATWCSATTGTSGVVSSANSLVGNAATAFVGNGDVLSLPNGNYAVRSVGWTDGVTVGLGAVTWGNGNTGTTGIVDSTNSIVGGSASDNIGANGLFLLSNGNFIVRSLGWDNPGTGATNAGAVTWCSGSGPTAGVVSAANSIVGSTTNDGVGNITQLSNGNFVVWAPSWDNGGVVDAGAVTWVNGFTGNSGAVSAGNSYVGSSASDGNALFITPLNNGNCVFAFPSWDNTVAGATDAGAVTWLNGFIGGSGALSAATSLVGSTTNDFVGTDSGGGAGVHALTNGNYVVRSVRWDNAGVVDAGAATWADGTTGIVGTISSTNSLVGTTANDLIGGTQLVALNNGNYVVNSSQWDNGATANVGAATWGNGATGIVGAVSPANSLIGVTAGDSVGSAVISALANGNYVVRSSSWTKAGTGAVGAITWCDGSVGSIGVVDASNSMIGSTVGDAVGFSTAIPAAIMPNGSFAILSRFWGGGVGAVTWGNGTGPLVGTVSAANSLVGSTNGDLGAGTSLGALPNGNFVVRSSTWTNTATAAANAGMVAWGSQLTGISGVISNTNALVGTTANDSVGSGITNLSNGHYVVNSLSWNGVGAATWSNGFTGTFGDVSAANSLVGSITNDLIGNGTVALNNGNYVVSSSIWDNGAVVNAGAVAWGNGFTGTSGVISAANAVVGSTTGDQVGTVFLLGNGDYLVLSERYDDGASVDVGAATFVNGSTGQTLNGSGIITVQNSLIGASGAGPANLAAVSSVVTGKYYVRFPHDGGGRVRMGMSNPGNAAYNFDAAGNYTIHPSVLTNSLNAGTSVLLQANTAINIDSDIIVNNPTGNGGNLTFASGRSFRMGSVGNPVNITTDNGNVLIIGNDLLVNGVVDAQRDIGNAFINMNDTSVINAGTGIVTFQMRSGAGLTNNGAGQVVFKTVNAAAVNLSYTATTGNGLILDGGSFSGQVTIQSNMAKLNGGTATFPAGLFINSGGRLGGSGTVNGNLFVNPGGTLAAGNSPGIIVIAGDLTLTGASTLDVEVNGTTAGTQYDQYQVTGDVILGGATLNMTLGYIPLFGDSYTIIDNQGGNAVSGTFAGLAEGATFTNGGYDFQITYVGGNGNDVVISAVTNTAPQLIAGGLVAQVAEDTVNPPGTTVFGLFSAFFNDSDAGSDFAGIAITNDASTGAQGVWQYSTDAGTSWFNVGTVTNAAALVIQESAGTTMMRFLPAANYNGPPGDLSVRAFDNTYGGGFTAGGTQVYVDTTVSGGSSPFSDPVQLLSTYIFEVNDAPVANNDSISSCAEDTIVYVIPIAAVITNNDSVGPANESTQTLTVNIISSVGGTATVMGANVEFQPTPDFNGAASFDYTVTDNGTTNGANDFKTSNIATVSFTITEVNDAPTGVNETIANIAEDSGIYSIPFATLTANDITGPANESTQTLTIIAVGSAVGGSVAINAGTVEFTPTADFNGAASFQYTIQDNGTTNGVNAFLTSTATASFTITEVNDAPTGVGETISSIAEDSGVYSIPFATLTVNDITGPANESTQTLTIIAVGSAVGGSVAINAGNVEFTPTADFNGPASFQYTIRDNGTTNGVNDFLTSTATASFTITEVNDAPTGVDETISNIAEDSGVYSIPFATLTANDITGPANESTQTLTITVVGSAVGGSVAINAGNVEFTPTLNYNGPASFQYTIRDNGTTNGANDFLTSTATASFTITAVNDAPVVTGNPALAAVNEDTANPPGALVSALVSGNVTDVDAGSSVSAIAVITNTANAVTEGSWQYSANLGANWFNIDVVANNNALVLQAGVSDARVRFLPVANYFGVPPPITFRALDNTYGGAFSSTSGVEVRVTINATVNGTPTAISANTGNITTSITSVNDAPTFNLAPISVQVDEDSGAASFANFATSITAGPVNEAGQTLTFVLTLTGTTGSIGFSSAPAIDETTGELTFTPSLNTNGTASYSVELVDNGSGVFPNVNTSAAQSFTIQVDSVNDAPSFTLAAGPTVNEDAGAQTILNFATAISFGPADESGQTLNFVLTPTGTTGTLGFSSAPAINSGTGTLTFTASANTNGTASFDVVLVDNGPGIAPDVNTSATSSFTITVNALNDAPSFSIAGNPATINEDAGAQAVNGFATGMTAGPVDEAGQALTFNLTQTGGLLLFSAAPAISPATGQLTYTTAPNSNGTANFDVTLSDNGATGGGNVNTSGTQTFTITVNAINDPPSFTIAAPPPTVAEDAGAQTVAGFATNIRMGPLTAIDETTQTATFGLTLTGTTGGLSFSAGPAIASNGTLTYTASADSFGTATYDARLTDNGGGADTSGPISFTITVTSQNDAPVTAAPASITVTEDVASNINGISFSDVDSAGGIEDAVFTVTAGTLTAVNSGGVTVVGSGTASITLSGTLANLNAFIAANRVTYTTALNSTTSQTLSLSIDDNGNTGAGGVQTSTLVNVTLNVTAVNDAPAIAAPASIGVTEDVASFISGISVSDVDAAAGAITLNFAAASGTFSGVDAGGVTVAGSGTNSLTLTGTVASINAFIAAANNLAYTTALNSTVNLNMTVTANDQGNTGAGGAQVSAAIVLLTITAVNDAPVTAAPASIAVTEDVASNINGGINFSDVDAAGAVEDAVFSVSSGTLTAVNSGGVTVVGSGTASITLTGTLANLNAFVAANRVTYTTALNSTTSQTLSLSIDDNGNTGTGGVQTSVLVNVTLNVTAVNDTPTIVAPGSIAVIEDVASPITGITITDVDSGANDVIATVQVTAGTLNAITTGGVTVGGTPTNRTLTGTVANINTYISGSNLTYTTVLNSTASQTLSIFVNDQGFTGLGGALTSLTSNVTLNVTAQNDPPIVAAPASITVVEDVASQITGITVSDVDSGAGSITLTLSVTSGTLAATSGGGVAVTGSGTNSLTLTGTTTNVNAFVAAANAVMFTTALNSVTPVTLTSSANDNGNTPAPPQNSIAVNTTLNVTSINDSPTFNIPTTSVTVLEDAGPSTVANFAQNILAGPPDEAGQVLTFTVAFVSSTGGLTFSTAPAINATTGDLTFTTTANANGSATYNVTLTDNGSNVPPNSNTSTTVSITINVTAVNDAPTFTIGTPPTVDEDAGAQTVANFATAMSVGPANESAQTFVSFNVSFVSGGLTFSTPPAISAVTGNLTYQSAPNANGTATFDVTLTDSGSNVAPNVNTSIIHTFTITVTAVNDPPTFNIAGSPPAIAEDAPPQTVVGFATALSVGPANESAQTLVSFNLVLQAATGTLAFDSGPAISVVTGDLTYAPTINTNGTATYSVTLTDSGSNVPPNINTSAPQFFTITVGAVNDAPVYDISGFSILNAIVEDDFTNPGTSITAIIASGAGGNPITDVDVGAIEGLAVTAVDNTNGQWEYSLNGIGGPWIAFNPLTVQPNNATLLRSNGAQDRIRFVPNPNYFSDPPGLPTVAGTIQARAWDQTTGAPGGNADTTTNGLTTAFSINVETISITVDSVNDAPVIAGAGQTYLFHENNNFFNPIPVCDTVSASDLDLDNQFPAFFTIQIIPAPNGANEFLSATDTPPGVVATYTPGTHTLTLAGDGTGTWGDFSTVLQSVRYSNLANPINIANRIIRITVNDGRGGQDVEDNFITFNPAPIITLPIPDRTYTENAPPLVFDSTATVTDNNANFNGGRLIVTLRTDDGTPTGNPTWLDSDRLWVVNQGTGTNQIRVTNSDVFFEGLTQIGTIDAVDNGQNATVATPPLLIVHLNANATPFRTQALVRAIAFDNSSDNPGTTTRISEFIIWDGDALTYNGAISFPRIKQMFVVPVNDAPVYDNTGVTLFTTINEDDVTNPGDAIDALIASAGGDRITDVDNFAIEGIAVTFVDNSNGTWQYSLDGGAIWHDFPFCTNASATLLSAVPADGDRIRFVPGLDFAGTATITFRAWDQTSGTRGLVGVDTTFNGSTSAFSIDIETATITVTTDNDAPVVTLPTADPTYVENAAQVYVDHFATITDVDSVDFVGGTLVADIIAGANFGDALGFNSVGTGAGEILIDTANVLYEGIPIGTWALSNSDRTLTVTFTSANATPDAAQGVLRHITFINTTENPHDDDRIVRFVVTDGDGGTSVQRIKRIFVVITNDTPIANAGPDQTYLNAGALTTVTLVGSATVDPDGDSLKYRWEGDNNGPSVIRDNVGDPFVPSIPNETVQLAPGTYHYTLTVRDPSNKVSTDLVTIIVRPKYVSTPIPGSNITIPGTVVGTTSAPFTLVVENTSTSSLTITLPVGGPFSGTHPNEFALSGAPVTIPSLGTANILLTCTPTALGTRLATLTLNTDDPTQPNVTYQLFCDSFGPGAKITSPLTVKGTLGVALSYTITATGQLPLTISVLSSVPPGMTVIGNTITGTPAASGFFGVTIQASNTVSTDTQFLTFSIVNSAPGHSNFPKFASPPSVTANPILVNTQVTFSAFATDVDGDVLGYYWNFGDGSDSRLSEVAHTFTTPGRYDVQISVSDGEHIIGRHLYVTVIEQGQATFIVSKALINFDFKTPAKSNVTISGKLPIDVGVSLANASVTWQVGPSLTRTFNVNNGIGGDSLNLIKFKSAAVGATQYIATYQITMKGTTLFTELTDIGYKNTTVPSKPLTTFPVSFSITIDAGTPSVTTFDTSYVAVRNKYGKAKKIVLP